MEHDENKILEHLKKLAIAYADELMFLDSYGFGEWGVDQRRPFGNSLNVETDILEVCDIEPDGTDDGEEYYSDEQREYARYLYRERLGDFLKDAIRGYCSVVDAIASQKQNIDVISPQKQNITENYTFLTRMDW